MIRRSRRQLLRTLLVLGLLVCAQVGWVRRPTGARPTPAPPLLPAADAGEPVASAVREGRGVGRRLRAAALASGALLGVAALLLTVLVTVGGFSLLMFRSGSMGPTIPTGALALAHTVDAADLRVGDVVSVPLSDGSRVTHRVQSTTLRGDEATLVLKGDANLAADRDPYEVTSAERVVASVPGAAYVVAWLLTPNGLVVAACLSGMLLILSGEPDGGRAPRTPRTPRAPRGPRPLGRPRRRRAAGLAVATVAAVGLASGTSGTLASFTDPATLTSGSFGAATVDGPVGVACSTQNGTTAIRWSAPAGPAPTGWSVTYTYNGNTSSTTLPAGTTSFQPPAGGFFSNRNYTVTVTTVVGPWTSATSGSDTISVFTFFGSSYSC